MRAAEQVAPRYFEIHVVDAETGRGIPLVELETVDHVRQVTDNAGRIAYFEPGHPLAPLLEARLGVEAVSRFVKRSCGMISDGPVS
jgi:hypothetical protein